MKIKIKAVLVGGAAAAAIAAALSGAGSANASCSSLNGHNIGGHGCESTVGSASIALGHDAQAVSAGPGSVAIAVGNPGYNRFYPTKATIPTKADAQGTGNVSVALGDGSNAGTLGSHNTALVLGNGSNAFSYGGNAGSPLKPFGGTGNTSVTLAHGSEAGAVGNHQISTAFQNNKPRRQNNGLGG